jgi:hypothetical protein
METCTREKTKMDLATVKENFGMPTKVFMKEVSKKATAMVWVPSQKIMVQHTRVNGLTIKSMERAFGYATMVKNMTACGKIICVMVKEPKPGQLVAHIKEVTRVTCSTGTESGMALMEITT